MVYGYCGWYICVNDNKICQESFFGQFVLAADVVNCCAIATTGFVVSESLEIGSKEMYI